MAGSLGVALFGVSKGNRQHGTDHHFTDSLRYMFSGDRSIVLMSAIDLLEWATENSLVSAEASAKTRFDELCDLGWSHIAAEVQGKMKDRVRTYYAQLAPGSLIYIPGTWLVWDCAHSAVCGLRFNSYPRGIDELKKLAETVTSETRSAVAPFLQSIVTERERVPAAAGPAALAEAAAATAAAAEGAAAAGAAGAGGGGVAGAPPGPPLQEPPPLPPPTGAPQASDADLD